MFESPLHEEARTGARVTARGDAWTVESRTLYADCEAVRLSGIAPSNDGAGRTLLLPFDRIVPLASRPEPRVLRPRTWNRLVLTAIARNRPFGSVGAAASGRIRILPFQLEPALAMLRHGHTRVLVADEVGLGKTIQASLVLAELSAENDAFRGIVLAPASLTDQWVREVRERFQLVATRTDAGWLASQTRRLPPDVNPWSLPGIFVASLDLVKRPEVLRALEDVTWDVIVVDEAHAAGVGTARRAAAHAIATRSRRVLLLTATPADGDPPQLAALLGIGDTGDPIVQFRRSRADVGHPSRRRTVLLQVRLSPAERRMHRLLERYTAMVWADAGRFDSRARLTVALLRKRALSSALSLATSVQRRAALLVGASPNDDRQLVLPLADEDPLDDGVTDGVLGAPGLADAARERALLARIEKHALVASRCESKVGVLLRLIRRVRQPAIVFTEYRDTLFHLALALRAAGHDPLLLHGGMLARDRAESIRVFDERDSLLLATDAASEGLNLHQRCRLVVHFELPWTPARIEQRTGRVDRLGQARGVHEVLLVARDTAERVVLVPLVRRARLAVGGGVPAAGALLAITESIVAAAIIGDGSIGPLVPESGCSASYCRLIQEGEAEANRIAIERHATARFRVRSFDDAILITALRRCSPPRLTLLLQVLLSHRAGRPVHSELVVLQTDVRWEGDRRARQLRKFVALLLDERWESLVAAVECHAAVSVEAAARQHALVIARLQQRDRAMLKTLPSAAAPGTGGVVRQPRTQGAGERAAGSRADRGGRGRARRCRRLFLATRTHRTARGRPSGLRMIPGLSGTILSHDALHAGGLTLPAGDGSAHVQRVMLKWHAGLSRTAGPAWTARKVFDEVTAPLCNVLGFHVVPVVSGPAAVHAVLLSAGEAVAVAATCAWGQDLGSAWRESVRRGIGAAVRWCFCFNGPALRLFDATRTHSRRFVELDVTHLATDPATFALAWRLLRAEAFVLNGQAGLDAAVMASERHRSDVRDCLQSGVQEALSRLTSAFVAAARKSPRRRGAALSASDAYEESLIVIYRILFLLFAEARGLVPNWHPIFRDNYTVEALRPVVESELRPRGLWEALQAIARLAHRGCRAGTLRVPAFNGRLFAPSHAPLADSLPLDDTRVRDALLGLTTRQDREGRRRIAYADLGVEHLGGVYERVLDFEINTAETDGAAVLVRSGRRKSTGTFYTPRTLTEYLVRRTLAPLVEQAGSDDILRLRIVDPAMGSGAFLVASCRYLALAYESALVREGVTTAADLTESDRASFRRAVAQRCLYGVDVNPMAVQLARLSLWLATLCGDRPLTFFDHQLRAGNSLAGAAVSDVTRGLSGGSRRAAFLPLFDTETLRGSLGSAVMSHIALRDGPEDTLDQIRSKERVFANLSSPRGPLARWKRIVDLWCAAWFQEGVRGMSRGLFQSLLDERTLPGSVAEPLLESAQEVARRERFFHWRLEFPEVFSDGRGEQLIDAGFDAVIGNPPWEMLRGDSGAAATRRTSATAAARLTRFTRGSGIYRFQGGGHANLYQLFVERALSLARRSGRIGLVLPSGFATDHGCANLRRRVLDATTVDSLVSVDNREAIFPVHRGLKFLLFTTTVAGRTPAVPFRAGPRTSADFGRLPEAGPDPEAVALSRELLERMSGEQLAIPDVRTQADAALAARLVFAHAGAGDAEGWGLRFGRELNATDDRRHFSPDAAGALPVIEGKQIQPFGVAVERSNLFIGPAAAARLLPGAPFNCVRLAYRDVASSTNRVTLIAAILPAGTVTTHTLFCLKTKLDGEAQHFLCGMLNSFVANYLVRIRVTTHVTVAIIGCLPLPKPGRDTEEFRLMASVAMKLAHNPADLAASAWHQALAARIYGLTKGEFAHVLSTFPLVDRSARDSAMTAFLGTL